MPAARTPRLPAAAFPPRLAGGGTLAALLPFPLPVDLGDDLRACGVDDVLGLIEQLADVLAVRRRLGFDRRRDQAAVGPAGVAHAPFVAGAVVGAAPRCLGSQVQAAEAGHFTGRICPALEVLALL